MTKFSSIVQPSLISLIFSKHVNRDFLDKQILALHSSQSPTNIKHPNQVKCPKIKILFTHYFACFMPVKNQLQNFPTLVIGSCSVEFSFFLAKIRFFRNLNHLWRCREQKKNFEWTLVIIFWSFKTFSHRFDSSRVKWSLMSSIKKFINELS